MKRGWTDFEPKVITGLLTGSLAAFVTSILGNYGIHLSALQQNFLVVGFYFVGAYITPSSGQTVTRTVRDAAENIVREIEGHTGASVSVITGNIPVQRPAADVKPTEVIPSQAQRFMDTLPSSQGSQSSTIGSD